MGSSSPTVRDTNGLMNPSASTNASPGTSPSLVRTPAIRPPSATSPSTVTPNRKSTLERLAAVLGETAAEHSRVAALVGG